MLDVVMLQMLSMVCGAWSVLCDVGYLVCTVLCAVWCAVRRAWYMLHRMFCVVCCVRCENCVVSNCCVMLGVVMLQILSLVRGVWYVLRDLGCLVCNVLYALWRAVRRGARYPVWSV